MWMYKKDVDQSKDVKEISTIVWKDNNANKGSGKGQTQKPNDGEISSAKNDTVADNNSENTSQPSKKLTVKDFKFILTRFKDSASYIESMRIDSVLNNSPAGSVHTSVGELKAGLEEFLKYGIVLSSSYICDIERQIQDNYLDIPVEKMTIENNRFDLLIESLREYIESDMGDSKYTNSTYTNIPVDAFNNMAYDCGFSRLEKNSLRKELDDKKYISGTSGRLAVTVKVGGKAIRAIRLVNEAFGFENKTKKGEEVAASGN